MTPGIRPPSFVAYRLRMLTLSIRLLGLIVRNRKFSHPDMGKRLYPFAMTHLWMRPERASGSITDVFGSKLGPFVPEYPAKMRYNTQTKP
jgi:hypothetical protein